MTRRTFLGSASGALLMKPLFAADLNTKFDKAANALEQSVASGQVLSASLFVQSGSRQLSRSFGDAKNPNASFLLGSITKPIAVTALMTLYDKGKFDLDDLAQKYLPEFNGKWREKVTIRHLLTHTSGLPDQLPQNAELRSKHARLSEFVDGVFQVPLHFEPGTMYEYSSMAILLAAEIAQRLSGMDIKQLVQTSVLEPLDMRDSALGIGSLPPDQMMRCQVEFGAVESGAGSENSNHWNWNSSFWRQLGAPWGGQHASAADVGKFLHEFLHPTGILLKPNIAKQMIRNHNASGLESRGLGFDVGMESNCSGCSPSTFGHTGSTGTIAWADPERDLICVVLTSLPSRALPEGKHPRQLASNLISSK
jgi:CubicO group peptidase (beta-lactamase class C family)